MNKRISFSAIGAASLIVIFAVLCLITFATLCISTVQADIRLSEKSANAVLGYYSADCRAQEFIANLRQGTVDESIEFTLENGIYSYYFKISETQSLAVEVLAENGQVVGQRVVSTADWEADDSLTVWDGEF